MMNKLRSLKDWIVRYYGVTTLFNVYMVVFTITFVLLIITGTKCIDIVPEYIDYTNGWVTSEGETFSGGAVMKSVSISNTLPLMDKEETLFFRVKNLNVSVYIDDELYCDYGELLLKNEKYYKTPGTYFISVPLGISDSNKTVCIKVDCPYKNDSSCTITQLKIGNIYSIVTAELRSKLFGLSVCVVLIALGICFICITIPMRKYESVETGHSLLYLGLFAFLIGIWALTETKLLQLITMQSVFIHYLNNLSLMIAVIPLFIFFSKRHQVAKSFTVYIVGGLFLASYIVSCSLHFLGIYDLHETVKLTQLCLVVSVLFTFYYAYCCFKHCHYKDIAFIGLFFIALCSGLDVILYYKQVTSDNSILVRLGVLIYVLVIGTQLITEYVKAYQKGLRAETWRKKAYTDGLTGLYNRTAFMERLQFIDRDITNENCVIIVFDLNDLKHINDTFGHSFGDMAIKEAASAITGVFGGYGRCYRIGGDEFVCIFDENMAINDLESVCAKFLNDVKVCNNVNAEKRPYTLGIAFGYSFINHTGGMSSKMAFDAADAEMYIKKQQLKQKISG